MSDKSNLNGTSSNNTEQNDFYLLDKSIETVQRESFYMKRCLDNNDLDGCLKNAIKMISTLQNNNLSPPHYYELYISVTQELRLLQDSFNDITNKPNSTTSIEQLYDICQYSKDILPRLYLLITAGSCYILQEKAPFNDILFDLVELCRGVQHPMRGLFLRDYLSQMSKDKFYNIIESDNNEAINLIIDFILSNFNEMNKLWVRMQHQGTVKNREKRSLERKKLRQLVGTNLVRLSEIEYITLDIYKDKILPCLLEQIVNCKDSLAQEYLMDCIIQVFPDEYHLSTLELFLSTCGQNLQTKVNVKSILETLMLRLSNFFVNDEINNDEILKMKRLELLANNKQMFPLFHKYSADFIESRGISNLSLDDILALQVSLINFSAKCYPKKLKYIDHILRFSSDIIQQKNDQNQDIFKARNQQHLIDLLSLPLETIGCLKILHLKNYAPLMSYLSLIPKKRYP